MKFGEMLDQLKAVAKFAVKRIAVVANHI